MNQQQEQTWATVLASELEQSYYQSLLRRVNEAYQTQTVFPPQHELFAAFTYCPLPATKVVILGQDPYHGEGQAHGLAFSVPEGVKIPPSLKNIYKELSSDLGLPPKTSGNLLPWAKQGVLLLNATLTVTQGQPGSHHEFGWEIFTDTVIKTISKQKEHVVFMLWGKYAAAKAGLIDETKHLILTAPHPSPLSAYTGFFGCKHFSKANLYLKQQSLPTITW